MKKYFIIASILFLASACSKPQPAAQPAPSQGQPQASSSPSVKTSATSTPAKPVAPSAPVTLNVYSNSSGGYRVSYLNYFSLITAANFKASSINGAATSACQPYGQKPDVCFALKNQPYANTNLDSAAVGVSALSNIKNIQDCGTFAADVLNGGKLTAPVTVNGIVFVTATASDAGAGNYYETHFNRAWNGSACYEITESVHWSAAQNFSPPRAEFDSSDVWNKLDVLRNGFQFIQQQQTIPRITL